MSRQSSLHDKIEEHRGFKYVVLKSGRKMSFWDAHREAESAQTALSRSFSRMAKTSYDEFTFETLERYLDGLETYLNAMRHFIKEERERRDTKRARRERIAQLRETAGRTPEEAAMYLRKAEELERKFGAGA